MKNYVVLKNIIPKEYCNEFIEIGKQTTSNTATTLGTTNNKGEA